MWVSPCSNAGLEVAITAVNVIIESMHMKHEETGLSPVTAVVCVFIGFHSLL
jgi:hypothetical protein